MKTKIALHFYVLEIRIRFFYVLLSLLLTFLTTFFFSFDLIYSFVRPFFAPKNFIFTDLTEALDITIKICIIYTISVWIPYFLYQFWCFFIPSFYDSERKKMELFFWLFLGFFVGGMSITYFFLLPEISKFLFAFEIKKEWLTIQLEARILSYVQFTSNFYWGLLGFFQTPTLITMFFVGFLWDPSKLSNYRKYCFVCSVLIAGLISPPDVIGQFCLVGLFVFLYEKMVWLGFLYRKGLSKQQPFTRPPSPMGPLLLTNGTF